MAWNNDDYVQGARGPKRRPFASLVDMSGECWVWTGATFSNGYGRATGRTREESVGAHRRSWDLEYGPIPDGMVVMHKCDNRICVRPAHLELGTPADNMRDMAEKGRSLRGGRNSQARLNENRVRCIRTLLNHGATKASLARALGVSEAAVWNVATGRTWGWV